MSMDIQEMTEEIDLIKQRMEKVEKQVVNVDEAMQKAVAAMMPKIDALLRAQKAETNDCVVAKAKSVPSDDGGTQRKVFGYVAETLLEAAEHGDVETLARLLTDGAETKQRDRRGYTALHLAAMRGNLATVVLLLGFGAEVGATAQLLRTPLHCAAAHGHLQVTQRLLRAGAKMNAQDTDGATALSLAAEGGHANLVAMLIDNGACLDVGTAVASREGEKLVFKVATRRHLEVIELLLRKETFVDVCSKEGDTLLVHAAKTEQWEVVKLLLEKGASATKCQNVEECVLALAAKSGQANVVSDLLGRGAASEGEQVKKALMEAKTAAVVWAILEAVPSVIQAETGGHYIASAALNGRLEPMVALLEASGDTNVRVGGDNTALHNAAFSGRIACVNELIYRGADVDARNKKNETPLHFASRKGCIDAVRALMAAGASASVKNNHGKTPVDIARTQAVRKIFETTF